MTEAARDLLQRADAALRAAESLTRSEQHDIAVGRAYYVMYYCAQALLGGDAGRFKKHAGVHAAFGERFARTGRLDPKYHRWLLAAYQKQLYAEVLRRADAVEAVAQARDFLQATLAHLAPAEP